MGRGKLSAEQIRTYKSPEDYKVLRAFSFFDADGSYQNVANCAALFIKASAFGGLVTFLIYGGIMNPASVLMYQANPDWQMILTAYITGVPADAIHALATGLFLWFLSEPMLEKLDRVKVKYGLIER